MRAREGGVPARHHGWRRASAVKGRDGADGGGAPLATLSEDRGQAAVELALLLPAMVVVALVIINIGRFVECCARFDRAAPDMALAHGASPAGEQDAASATGQVKAAIEQAMGDPSLEVEVRVEPLDFGEAGLLPALSPGRVRFVCSMAMRPVPSSLSIAGVSARVPPILRHECSVVVDVGTVGSSVGG